MAVKDLAAKRNTSSMYKVFDPSPGWHLLFFEEQISLAAVAKWTCKHVRLARCSRE